MSFGSGWRSHDRGLKRRRDSVTEEDDEDEGFERLLCVPKRARVATPVPDAAKTATPIPPSRRLLTPDASDSEPDYNSTTPPTSQSELSGDDSFAKGTPATAFTELKPASERNHDEESLRKAKRILLYELKDHPRLLARIERFVAMGRSQSETGDLPDACPLYTGSQYSSKRKVHASFGVPLEDGSRSVSLNYGLAAMIVAGNLTKEQKDGCIHHKWHLSHLCGNFRCTNLDHFHVESGSINQERKRCHNKRQVCPHRPKRCLVDNVVRDKHLITPDSSQESILSHFSQTPSEVSTETALPTAQVEDDGQATLLEAQQRNSLSPEPHAVETVPAATEEGAEIEPRGTSEDATETEREIIDLTVYDRPAGTTQFLTRRTTIDLTSGTTRELVDLTDVNHIILFASGEVTDLTMED